MTGITQARLRWLRWNRRPQPMPIDGDARATGVGRRDTVAPPAQRSQPPRIRLSLRERLELRRAIAYAVEAPEGEIGFVTEVRFAPYDFWPEELIVDSPDGPRLRVPIDGPRWHVPSSTVAAVLPREGRLLVTKAPPGARPVAPLRPNSLTTSLARRVLGAAGAVLGVGGFVATLAAVALDVGLRWAPALAAIGAVGGVAATASWRKHGHTWLAATGLGSFWMPLTVGLILSLVRFT